MPVTRVRGHYMQGMQVLNYSNTLNAHLFCSDKDQMERYS